ncbi:helix-turn-helix domain-containing protein [Nocardia noduli]|uniref:helix-turn-helix domain-containing protein n=1 Tax=Nocardia noduli TaxID=2815722 RepID=UPI001C2456CF|nr:helix-turn-helix transcriptional regulator [Nocardia noduli]
MGGHLDEMDVTESARLYFGAELRYWRMRRNLSVKQLGAISHDSGSLVAKVEVGQRRPTHAFAIRMDSALDTGGVLGRVWCAATSSSVNNEQRRIQAETNVTGHSDTDAASSRRQLIGPDFGRGSTVRRVGAADIAVMWGMCQVFADADHHLGGGYTRTTLATFLNDVVEPALRGSYDDRTAAELYSVAARLTGLAAFMCFDSARQASAEQFFRQALSLAKAGENGALVAHILTDMSMQAHYRGRTAQAIELGEAAVNRAKRSGSPRTAARSSAVLARAFSLHQDNAATGRAMLDAEKYLGRAQSDEPVWIQFFTEQQLAAEFMYVEHDAGRSAELQRQAPAVLERSDGMERRHVLAAATLAGSYLGRRTEPNNVSQSVEKACQVLRTTFPAARGLTSARAIAAINSVRMGLVPHATMAVVKQTEAEFQTTVVTGG